MNNHYLITAIGGDIGNSVLSCMNQEFPQSSLFGCDITPYVPGCDKVEGLFLVPPYMDEEYYITVLLKKCRKHKITHILPMTEGEIKVFNRNRNKFYAENIKLMINSPYILDTTFSKYRTAEAIKNIGLKSPETWKPKEIPYKGSYPIVVKSDQGCGSKNVRIVNCYQEYEAAISQIPNAIIQEYIGDNENEYTVGVFSNGNDIKTIAFRRTLGFGGMSKVVEQINDERINTIAETVVENLNLRGSINIQMRKQEGEYYIFEINPRISSSIGFRYKLGFNDVKWWLDLLDGYCGEIPYSPEPLAIIGIRALEEKIFRNGFPKVEEIEE